MFSSLIAVFVSYLWRVDVDGNRPVERLELAGVGALTPATVPSKDQLAFTRLSYDVDVYRFQPGRPVQICSRVELSGYGAEVVAGWPPDRLLFWAVWGAQRSVGGQR